MNAEALSKKPFLSLAAYGARPKTLVASLFPVVLGMLLARFQGNYNVIVYLATLLTAMFIQIGTNYANDYFDAQAGRDTKERLGPPRIGSLDLISKTALLSLTIISFTLACLFAIPLVAIGGNLIISMLALSVVLGIFYSYSRYSLANTGLANIVVFTVFGPLGTLMAYYFQTGAYDTKAAVFGIIPGCLSLMMFAMNNLRDFEEDKKSDKKTLVVRFGFDWGKREYICSLFLSWLCIPATMMLYSAPLLTLLPFLLLPKGLRLARKVLSAKTPLEIVPLFEETAKYNALFALIYIISWRLSTVI